MNTGPYHHVEVTATMGYYLFDIIFLKQIAFKTTTKKIIKILAHRRLGYINNKNLDKFLKILTSLKLNKNSPKLKIYKLYTKGK